MADPNEHRFSGRLPSSSSFATKSERPRAPDLKNLSSLLISSLISTLMLHPAARALPFEANSGDFEAFVNQVWRSGGAGGVNIGPSMRSSDPARESRRYWGFHNCIWKTNPNTINADTDIPESIGGHAYEIFQCNGYLDYETPMKKERCKGRFSYEWRKKDGVWGKYVEQSLKRILFVGACYD